MPHAVAQTIWTPGGQFGQPWPVGGAHPYRLLAGEEVVLGVAGRAGGGRERVQDAVYVEQEQREAGGHCLLIVPWAGRAGKSQRRRVAALMLAGSGRRVIVAR